MKIVLVSAEIVPFSKTGGMADVVGALADALARAGHRVLTVSPRYGVVDASAHGFTDPGIEARVDVGGHTLRPYYLTRTQGRRTDALVCHPVFDRAGIYGDRFGSFGDNHLRFALLSRAGIEAARRVPQGRSRLGEDVVFHVHDWHTALVAVYLNALYRPLGLFSRAPTVLTLHNVAHQGLFDASAFGELELAPRWLSGWALEWHGHLSLLKGGIMQCERLTTVSPTYARELLQDGGAAGMELPLRHRHQDLHGIRNGIDAHTWDPANDPHLDATYSADDLSGKATCKAALQAELGLPVRADAPMAGSVGRLDPQKGVDMLIESVPWMVEAHNAQVVVLGSAAASHQRYEAALRHLQARYPNHVRACIGFSERLAHRIEAGADVFLMPSLFEPCGLNQLYSLRYGTPPVVRWTGGLADSVQPYNPTRNTGTGWVFGPAEGPAFREAVHWALHTWRNHPSAFRAVQRAGMTQDLSWDAVVPAYLQVYEAAAARRGAMPR